MKLASGNIKVWLAKNVVQLVIFTILSVLILLSLDEREMVPATSLFTGLATVFSYQALCYSREKFRLDLFERRLEFYGSMVNLCSMVTQGFIESEDLKEQKAVDEARYQCIRGNGLHKAHLLFGNDIVQKIKELDQAFTTLSMAHTARRSSANFDAQEEMRAFSLFQQTVNSMPIMFSPYIYFGDYQRR